MTYLTRRRGLGLAGLSLAAVALTSLPAQADSPARQASTFASGSGNILYLAAGVGLPLLSDGRDGKNHALRAADALGTSVLLSEGIKALVREKRPDSNAHDSFPSGHATAAFAVATVEGSLHPHQAPLWYLGAALISASRIRLHRHTPGDVVAGAALGFGVSRLELSQPRGLLLSPFITPGGVGVQMTHGLGQRTRGVWWQGRLRRKPWVPFSLTGLHSNIGGARG